jgi:isopenicillin-N N-acyltransferase-like protein
MAREYFDMRNFREIDIAGTAYERGVMHGTQLRSEIADALDFYRDIFKLPAESVLNQAAHFHRVITAFNPDYSEEIRGIADGSEQELLWIVALNARTEILALTRNTSINECTSMCFPDRPVLGQNWDWGERLEALCAVMRISRPDGHVIRMLGEPGIIGKIGMNNAGLGVCLNILTLSGGLDGVPVHVMLRAILDCKSADEAASVIDRAPTGKASNIIVADSSGHCFDTEFAGGETLDPGSIDGNFIHTNHYLAREINAPDDPLFFNSRARMNTATQRVSQSADYTAAKMIAILSDRSHEQFPIYRPYVPDEVLQSVGTVATIVMDLSAKELHIRKGNDPDNRFTNFTVN